MNPTFQFNTLVLSGGGVRGVMTLSALQQLYPYWSGSVRTVVGTSVGGLIGLLLILGYEPCEIDQRFLTADVLSHFKRERIVWADALKQRSLFSWTLLENLLRFACLEKLFFVPTLSELQRSTGKRLIVSTWNLTQEELEYLTPESHPDMCVIQALRMTSAIWFVFEKVIYNGYQYVDGSVGDHCPWRYLVTGKNEPHTDSDDCLTTLIVNLPSPPPQIGSTLLKLILASIHVNQQQNEVMCMSLLTPAYTCWVDVKEEEVGESDPSSSGMDGVLSMSTESHHEQWTSGGRTAQRIFTSFIEANAHAWRRREESECMDTSPPLHGTTLRVRQLNE